jgi:anti-anti-sigma regulatory factor
MGICVGNLPRNMPGNDLREIFESFDAETDQDATGRRIAPQCRRSNMGIQYWSQDIILVSLPWKLQEHEELQKVAEMVQQGGACSVVVDFSGVDIAGGRTLTRLLELRRLLRERGRRLVLCGLAPATRGVFTIARLDEGFDFVKDKFAALAHLQILG